MTNKRNEWTWEEIAALRGKERKEFIETFGQRGKAALLASGHAPGTYKDCDLKCDGCPFDLGQKWIRGLHGMSCSEIAHAVYERMVRKLGVEPRPRRNTNHDN